MNALRIAWNCCDGKALDVACVVAFVAGIALLALELAGVCLLTC
jgi:hypothetical protein